MHLGFIIICVMSKVCLCFTDRHLVLGPGHANRRGEVSGVGVLHSLEYVPADAVLPCKCQHYRWLLRYIVHILVGQGEMPPQPGP